MPARSVFWSAFRRWEIASGNSAGKAIERPGTPLFEGVPPLPPIHGSLYFNVIAWMVDRFMDAP
jgi:hypothetical protein